MDKHRIVKAIDYAITGLKELRVAVLDGEEAQQVLPAVIMGNPNVQSKINTEALAHKLAWAYNTKHPEYKIDSQFDNLKEMIQSDKMSYVVAWMRKGDIKGIEDFFQLDGASKRNEMLLALNNFEEKIKGVFKQRFGHDS